MSRPEDLFGVLAVDKPAGMTSRDVVNHVQRLIRPVKVGHTGTLDPMATGVLLLAIGKATRLMEYAHLLPKSYEADFLLGQQSETLDTDGSVETLSDCPEITELQWQAEMGRWIGSIQQVPPKFSACHVDGRRAYDLARKGVEFQLSSRPVMIHALRLLDFQYPRATMAIECGSGTYIRSLGYDMATALGSSAVMSRLVRTSIGRFELSQCASLETLTDSQAVLERMSSPTALTEALPSVVVSQDQIAELVHGRRVELAQAQLDSICAPGQTDAESKSKTLASAIAALDGSHSLVAIIEAKGNLFGPIRVFI